jgi:C4-dicarboxylate transporter DctM subunit
LTTAALVSVVLILLILGGLPIFLALGVAGMAGLFMVRGSAALSLAPTSFFGQLSSFEMIALPLFILMGHTLAATPIGRDLFLAASRWLGWLRGGLAIASVGACTAFGAVSGVSIAGVASVGALAVPEMIERGYSRSLAAGAVVTAGALAMLIPPSVPFIIYAAVSGQSVAKLFIGGIVPGIALALALSLFIYARVWLRPEEAPDRASETYGWRERLASLKGIYRVLTVERLFDILKQSLRVSAAILLIMGCAKIFGDFLNLVRVPQTLAQALLGLDVPDPAILLALMALLIVLGMFVDAVSLIVVTTPILLPLIVGMGYDPLWFGIILVINLEIAVVTPPVGLNLYTLQGVCPFLRIEEIIRSSVPFVLIQVLVLIVFTLFPSLSLWLPGTLD